MTDFPFFDRRMGGTSVCSSAGKQTLAPPGAPRARAPYTFTAQRSAFTVAYTLLRARTPALPTLCSPFHQKRMVFARPCHQPIGCAAPFASRRLCATDCCGRA